MLHRAVMLASVASMLLCIGAAAWGLRSEWRDDYVSRGRGGDGCLMLASRRGAFTLVTIGNAGTDGGWAFGSQTVRTMPSIVLSQVLRPGVVPSRPRENWGGIEFSQFAGGAFGSAAPAPATYSRVQRVRSLTVPWAWPAALFGLLPALAAVRYIRTHHRVRPGRCTRCGYDLRASPRRCPECGTPHENVTA